MPKFEKGAQPQRDLSNYPQQPPPPTSTLPTPSPTLPIAQPLKLNRQNLIKKNQTPITQKYLYGKKIGSGSFGQVYKVMHKQLGLTRALKIIQKTQNEGKYDSYQELQILKKLDHPNVLKIYQYYEDQGHWFIVTEFFQGKELFQEIVMERRLTEHKAALIFAEICKAVSYIHSHSIAHRDIKPQNILIRKHRIQKQAVNTQKQTQIQYEYQIKLIDWGLGSRSVKQMIRKCGTPQYCAPEVLTGKYGIQCDIWSLGVLLYVMLAGRFPFKGGNVQQTLYLVSMVKLNFKSPQWQQISIQAKYLVSCLIKKQPKQRLTASQILKSDWLLQHIQSSKSLQSLSSLSLQQNNLKQTLQQLKQFTLDNKFHIVILNLIHNYINSQQKQSRLKKQFQQLDTNQDGVLSYQQLYDGYQKVYPYLSVQKLQDIVMQIFRNIDLDGSGKIQYSQFITFATKINRKFNQKQLYEIFSIFDEDHNGSINRKELQAIIGYQISRSGEDGGDGQDLSQFQKIISGIDVNGDGSITFQEFVKSIDQAVARVIGGKTGQSRTSNKYKTTGNKRLTRNSLQKQKQQQPQPQPQVSETQPTSTSQQQNPTSKNQKSTRNKSKQTKKQKQTKSKPKKQNINKDNKSKQKQKQKQNRVDSQQSEEYRKHLRNH